MGKHGFTLVEHSHNAFGIGVSLALVGAGYYPALASKTILDADSFAAVIADFANRDAHGVLLFGTGQIAGDDGTVDFGMFRAVGDPSGKSEGTAEALERPFKAEIHLAIRSHGPASADPAVLHEQLTTFNGGCPPNTCMTVQLAPHQP